MSVLVENVTGFKWRKLFWEKLIFLFPSRFPQCLQQNIATASCLLLPLKLHSHPGFPESGCCWWLQPASYSLSSPLSSTNSFCLVCLQQLRVCRGKPSHLSSFFFCGSNGSVSPLLTPIGLPFNSIMMGREKWWCVGERACVMHCSVLPKLQSVCFCVWFRLHTCTYCIWSGGKCSTCSWGLGLICKHALYQHKHIADNWRFCTVIIIFSIILLCSLAHPYVTKPSTGLHIFVADLFFFPRSYCVRVGTRTL